MKRTRKSALNPDSNADEQLTGSCSRSGEENSKKGRRTNNSNSNSVKPTSSGRNSRTRVLLSYNENSDSEDDDSADEIFEVRKTPKVLKPDFEAITPKPSAKGKSSLKGKSTSKTKTATSVMTEKPRLYPKNYENCNNNFIHFFNLAQKGKLTSDSMRRMHQLAVLKDVKTLKLLRIDSIFERRITSLTWHPNLKNLIGLASKGGGLILAEILKDNINIVEQFPGIGPGGSILALKFHPSLNEVFFTASLDGTVCYRNYLNKKCIQYLSTGSYDHWYTSFDMSEETGVMLAGDTKGTITLLSKSGTKVKEAKIHKSSKVNHIEFCPRKSWLFVTASLDRSVKLWDLRKITNNTEPLHTLIHEKPINSAYFSRTDSNHLLTTDQGSEIRVFQAPFWDLTNILPHPHRQFQHLTPIKASWHPLEDIVVCGRYPDPKFPGTPEGEIPTVDFMCPFTGKMLYQLNHPGFKGVMNLNQFNSTGDMLGTASGFKSIIWTPVPKKISEVSNRCAEDSKPDVYGSSTSHKVLDSLPVNRRTSKKTAKKQ